ncbi:MAG: cupredoxin domain-containing protein, partial [Phycisphaeraceae bacterium]
MEWLAAIASFALLVGLLVIVMRAQRRVQVRDRGSAIEARGQEGHASNPGGAIRVRVRSGYEPAHILASPEAPVRLIFRREVTDPCSERVVFPDYQTVADLPPFEDTLVELPAGRLGEHEFSCAEGKLRGTLVVQSTEERASIQARQLALPAAFVSFVVPGFGQFLLHQWTRGTIWLVGWFVVSAASG